MLKECETGFWSKYEVKVALHHARIIVKQAEKDAENMCSRFMEMHLAEDKAANEVDDSVSENDNAAACGFDAASDSGDLERGRASKEDGEGDDDEDEEEEKKEEAQGNEVTPKGKRGSASTATPVTPSKILKKSRCFAGVRKRTRK